MNTVTRTAGASRLYSDSMSLPDVLRFLRSQAETGTMVAALIILDPRRNLAVLATQSHSRGAALVTTGKSDHFLLLPVGRWKMLASTVGFTIHTEIEANCNHTCDIPTLPVRELAKALSQAVKKLNR